MTSILSLVSFSESLRTCTLYIHVHIRHITTTCCFISRLLHITMHFPHVFPSHLLSFSSYYMYIRTYIHTRCQKREKNPLSQTKVFPTPSSTSEGKLNQSVTGFPIIKFRLKFDSNRLTLHYIFKKI